MKNEVRIKFWKMANENTEKEFERKFKKKGCINESCKRHLSIILKATKSVCRVIKEQEKPKIIHHGGMMM